MFIPGFRPFLDTFANGSDQQVCAVVGRPTTEAGAVRRNAGNIAAAAATATAAADPQQYSHAGEPLAGLAKCSLQSTEAMQNLRANTRTCCGQRCRHVTSRILGRVSSALRLSCANSERLPPGPPPFPLPPPVVD
jgi:hypothetical protein